MNSLERILTTLGFQEPDRVPVLPVLLLQGAKALNLKLADYFQNAGHMAKGQEALMDRYGHDGVYGIPHVVEDIEPFGGQIVYCETGSPTVGKMAWRTWNDTNLSRVPDPTRHPALVRTLNTIEMLAKKFKGQKLIIGGAIAPLSLPSMLIGTEKLFELMFWEDELIRTPILTNVLNIAKDFCVAWCNAQLQAGADVVVLADGIASASCIMREHFQKYALPVLRETISAIQGTVVYEPVGRIEPFVDLLPGIGSGLVILECTDDIKKCKTVLNGKMAVMGNLNNIEMITWDRATTLNACFDLMDRVAPGGGFILGAQGPEIPWDVPDEVIQAIVEAPRMWKKR